VRGFINFFPESASLYEVASQFMVVFSGISVTFNGEGKSLNSHGVSNRIKFLKSLSDPAGRDHREKTSF
jgi:hypothetical protein